LHDLTKNSGGGKTGTQTKTQKRDCGPKAQDFPDEPPREENVQATAKT